MSASTSTPNGNNSPEYEVDDVDIPPTSTTTTTTSSSTPSSTSSAAAPSAAAGASSTASTAASSSGGSMALTGQQIHDRVQHALSKLHSSSAPLNEIRELQKLCTHFHDKYKPIIEQIYIEYKKWINAKDRLQVLYVFDAVLQNTRIASPSIHANYHRVISTFIERMVSSCVEVADTATKHKLYRLIHQWSLQKSFAAPIITKLNAIIENKMSEEDKREALKKKGEITRRREESTLGDQKKRASSPTSNPASSPVKRAKLDPSQDAEFMQLMHQIESAIASFNLQSLKPMVEIMHRCYGKKNMQATFDEAKQTILDVIKGLTPVPAPAPVVLPIVAPPPPQHHLPPHMAPPVSLPHLPPHMPPQHMPPPFMQPHTNFNPPPPNPNDIQPYYNMINNQHVLDRLVNQPWPQQPPPHGVPPFMPPSAHVQPAPDLVPNVDKHTQELKMNFRVNSSQAQMPLAVVRFGDDLSQRRVSVIESVYSALPFQCTSCASRFASDLQMAEHLDWHFKMNRRAATIAKNTTKYQQYFWTVEEWIDADDVVFGVHVQVPLETAAVASTETTTVSKGVPDDDSQPECPVCGDRFESVWDNDEDSWLYANTMRVKLEAASNDELEKLKGKLQEKGITERRAQELNKQIDRQQKIIEVHERYDGFILHNACYNTLIQAATVKSDKESKAENVTANKDDLPKLESV